MAKMTQNDAEKIQNKPTSCWVSDFVPGDFFVGMLSYISVPISYMYVKRS